MATLTSFNSYLNKRLMDPEFAEGFDTEVRTLRFGLSLCLLREKRGLTQTELATVAGLKQPMIARYEKGQIPNTVTLQKLAKALRGRVVIRSNESTIIEDGEELTQAE